MPEKKGSGDAGSVNSVQQGDKIQVTLRNTQSSNPVTVLREYRLDGAAIVLDDLVTVPMDAAELVVEIQLKGSTAKSEKARFMADKKSDLEIDIERSPNKLILRIKSLHNLLKNTENGSGTFVILDAFENAQGLVKSLQISFRFPPKKVELSQVSIRSVQQEFLNFNREGNLYELVGALQIQNPSQVPVTTFFSELQNGRLILSGSETTYVEKECSHELKTSAIDVVHVDTFFIRALTTEFLERSDRVRIEGGGSGSRVILGIYSAKPEITILAGTSMPASQLTEVSALLRCDQKCLKPMWDGHGTIRCLESVTVPIREARQAGTRMSPAMLYFSKSMGLKTFYADLADSAPDPISTEARYDLGGLPVVGQKE